MVDMEQYMRMFLEEAKEHLEQLTRVFLAWEREPEGDGHVQEAFRLVHTLKGMAATMELGSFTAMCHHLENVLDRVRNGLQAPDSHLYDTCLAVVDALEGLLGAVDEGREQEPEEVQSLISCLEAMAQAEQGQASPAPVAVAEQEGTSKLFHHELKALQRARSDGLGCFWVDVWLDREVLLKRARVYVIMQSLEEIGDIIRAEPPVEDLEEENFGDHFRLLLVTGSDSAGVEQVLHGAAEVRESSVSFFQADQEDLAGEEVTMDPMEAAVSDEGADGAPDDGNGRQSRAVSSRQTVRVDIERLDQMMNLVGELVITKTQLEQITERIKRQGMDEMVKGLDRISSNLQDVVMQARMVPVSQLFNRFPRMIRDLSAELGKKVRLDVKGEETELDRKVIDELADPLVHLIRNAIDHGLESEEERVAMGKDPAGFLGLLAFYEGNSVVIEISDDGRGIDVARLRQEAVARGVLEESEVLEMGDEDLIDLVFSSGFSTAKEVSDLSGRGVGLDAVRSAIEALNGAIQVQTKLGEGTSFRVKLPLTLAIIQALLICVGQETFAIPLERVEEIRDSHSHQVRTIKGRETITLRGEVLPLIRMHEALEVPDWTENDDFSLVVVNTGQHRAVLAADSLAGQQEVVIKSLGRLLSRIETVGGATILGDGEVALILDVHHLVGDLHSQS